MSNTTNDNKDKNQNRRKWYQITPYLDHIEIENILSYKYNGGCDAWMYLHFWSPLADWLVANTLPKWLAANIVTLFGFSWTLIPMIWLFASYGKFMVNPIGVEIPWWMFIFQSISYFLARLIDEMDGKQARRLKNGSILGLMVDHGCDAYAIGFFAFIMMKIVQGGDNILTLLAINMATMGFYVSTLEHYYTAHHFFGNGNMVTDGSCVVILGFAVLASTGNDFFANQVFESDKNTTWGQVIVYIMIALGFLNVVFYGVQCIKHKPNELTKKQFVWMEFALQIFGFVVMTGVTTSLIFIKGNSDQKSLYDQFDDQDAFEGQMTPLFSICMIQNFLMSHMNFSCILCHVTDQIFNPFKNKILLFTIFYVFATYMTILAFPDQQKNLMTAIYVLFGIQFFMTFHFIISLTRQLQGVLKVTFWVPFDPEKREQLIAEQKTVAIGASEVERA